MSSMVRASIVVVLALLASGCGGGDEPSTEPAPTGSSASADGDAPTEAESAIETTAPGTSLAFGERATVAWQPSVDLTGVVDVSVDAVAEQRRSVFEGWLGAEDLEDARPYFVTVTVANTGEDELSAQQLPLYLRDDNEALGSPWTLGGEFTACQSGPLPDAFLPGDEVEQCLVYLAPDGGRAVDVIFWPSGDIEPVSWSGEVAEPGEQGEKRPRKRRR